MKEKKIVLFFVLVTIIVLLGGCTSKKPEITYMGWYNNTTSEGQGIQAQIDKYNALQDKVKVNLILVSRADYETKLNTMAAANQLPDTCIMAEPMVLRYAVAGKLADISDMYATDEAPLSSLAFMYQGKPVAYSCADEVLVLYYNKKIFDEAKIPYPPASADKAWTWQEYIEVAKKLTKDKNGKSPNDKGFDAKNILTYGTDFNRLSWMWPVLAVSNGGGIISPDGKELLLGKPETVEALQAIADLYFKEKVAPSFSDKNAMPSLDVTLLTGKVAMATSGQWEIGVSLNNSVKDGLVYGVAVLPKMKKAVTYNTGGPFVVFGTSKNLAASKAFIKWWSDEQNGWETITSGIWMPVSAKWYADEAAMRKWADNPQHPPFEQYKPAVIDYAMNNAVQVPWYYFPSYDKINDLIDSGMDAVWNGKKTAQEYITEILPKVQELFDRNKID